MDGYLHAMPRGDFLLCLLQIGKLAAREMKLASLGGKTLGDCPADATRASGDEGQLGFQSQIHGCSLMLRFASGGQTGLAPDRRVDDVDQGRSDE